MELVWNLKKKTIVARIFETIFERTSRDELAAMGRKSQY